MIFQGNHSVIRAVIEKRQLQLKGKPHNHIRPLLLQGGGLMRGVYGLGAALALEEMGYGKSFTHLAGISSGALISAYFASGESVKNKDVLIQNFIQEKLLNVWKFWNQVDTKRLIEIMRWHKDRSLSFDKIKSNPSQLHFIAAEYKTAKPKIFSNFDEDRFFKALHASINMQNVSPYKVFIDNVHYTDGGFANPHALIPLVKLTNPTHVLFVTNNDYDFSQISKFEKFLNRTVFRLRLNGALTHAINSRRELRDEAISDMESQKDIDFAVVWGDGSVGALENSTKKLLTAIEVSRTWWHGLFSLE